MVPELSPEISSDYIRQMLESIKASTERLEEEVSVMAEMLESFSVNMPKEMI